jgi:hypothetical protein
METAQMKELLPLEPVAPAKVHSQLQQQQSVMEKSLPATLAPKINPAQDSLFFDSSAVDTKASGLYW